MTSRACEQTARASVGTSTMVPPIVHDVLRSPGAPLDHHTSTFMNARFEHDFSGVRVHTDERATRAAAAINARAYTYGRDVVFGKNQYAPSTSQGRQLIAHELAHVVQQNDAPDYPPLALDLPSGPGEREAHAAADAIAHSVPVSVVGQHPAHIARQVAPDTEEEPADDAIPLKDKAAPSCPVKATGTLSEVSWGETSGLYPGKKNKYSPEKWDPAKTCELLKARGAVHAVGGRGESVHKGKPKDGDAIEQKLKVYHLVENFPSLDFEIADTAVKWFYLSPKANGPKTHPGATGSTLVKSYGSFYNIGGGDVDPGDVFIHFYKLKPKTKRRKKRMATDPAPPITPLESEGDTSDDE